jgi:hypothetical protein
MTPHLIPPRQLVAATPAVIEEASIMVPRAPNLMLEVPTSIEDPEATIKLIHATTAALRAPREVRVATATRRSINPPCDLRDHINASADVYGHIENSRFARYKVEMERCRQFDAEHEGFATRQAPLPTGALGLCPFTERLRAVWWPMGFKVIGVNTYNRKANPAQWLTLYKIIVKAVGGDKYVMANYLPIMLNQSANN